MSSYNRRYTTKLLCLTFERSRPTSLLDQALSQHTRSSRYGKMSKINVLPTRDYLQLYSLTAFQVGNETIDIDIGAMDDVIKFEGVEIWQMLVQRLISALPCALPCA